MKTNFVIWALALIGLAIFGCVTSSQPQPVPPKETLTCGQYCPTLPHIQCVGQWKISGVYPDCNCNFECEKSPAPEVNNTPAPLPPPEPAPIPDEPVFPITTKSPSQLLTAGLDKIRTDFYRTHDGSFQENKYSWVRVSDTFSGPGEIGVFKGAASDVKFDNTVIESVQASGFYLFRNTADDSEDVYGIAVFNTITTKLDSYTGSDAFDVDYFPPTIEKNLRDCQVSSRDYNKNSEGSVFVTYFFTCDRAVDK